MTDDDPEILATYHERIRCLTERHFELYKDRVRVWGRWANARRDHIVMLADLRGPANHLWTRSKHYHWALMLLCVSVPFPIVPVLAWWPPSLILIGLGSLFLLPGIYYLVRSLKEIEFLQYKNAHGIIILDVGRNGPEVERFDEFIHALERQMERSATPQ